MYAEYVHWQWILAPRWLATLTMNLMRALLHLFSVPLLLHTLFAHWHKDAVPYRPGTISNYAMTFAWNMISRGIGFTIRTTMLAVWVCCELVLAAIALGVLLVCIFSPLLIILAAATGLVLLVAGL